MSREYRFDRYRKGRKMAEGLVLTKPTTVEQAMETVYLLADPSDTFVLREDLAKLATVEAERDAARAGEARAVEALEAEQRAAHWRNLARITDKHEDSLEATRLSEIAQRLRHGVVLVGNLPPLDWLAQQRREAAAEALKKLATDLRQDPWGGTLHDVDSLRSILCTRAAALQAGEVGNE